MSSRKLEGKTNKKKEFMFVCFFVCSIFFLFSMFLVFSFFLFFFSLIVFFWIFFFFSLLFPFLFSSLFFPILFFFFVSFVLPIEKNKSKENAFLLPCVDSSWEACKAWITFAVAVPVGKRSFCLIIVMWRRGTAKNKP